MSLAGFADSLMRSGLRELYPTCGESIESTPTNEIMLNVENYPSTTGLVVLSEPLQAEESELLIKMFGGININPNDFGLATTTELSSTESTSLEDILNDPQTKVICVLGNYCAHLLSHETPFEVKPEIRHQQNIPYLMLDSPAELLTTPERKRINWEVLKFINTIV